MARYIDADKLCEALKSMASVQPTFKQSTILGVVSSIENFPTADVVPRSEVDQWYHEYHVIKDELKREKMYHKETEKLADKYCAELQTAKAEVAAEIFEEIAFIVFDNTFSRDEKTYFNAENIVRKIGKLKKKYTEEKKDEKN